MTHYKWVIDYTDDAKDFKNRRQIQRQYTRRAPAVKK